MVLIPFQDSVSQASYPTTSIYRPSKAKIVILKQRRDIVYNIPLGQTAGGGSQIDAVLDACQLNGLGDISIGSCPIVAIQVLVAVKDICSGEIWDCDAIVRQNQILLMGDSGEFKLTAHVLEPTAWVLGKKTDFYGNQLPKNECTLVCLLPAAQPLTYNVRFTLVHCHGLTDRELDCTNFLISTFERGLDLADQQTGELESIEKPVNKLRMTGILASKKGRTIVKKFQDLGDDGFYDEFMRNKDLLFERVSSGKLQLDADTLLAVRLEQSIIEFGQNLMDDCLATCESIIKEAHSCPNSYFLWTKAFYIMSAVHRQRNEYALGQEYMTRSTECVQPLAICEETAVNRYNMGALLAERAATEGISEDQMKQAEQYFEQVELLWKEQKENPSNRDVIRSYIRLIMLHLKSSRKSFPSTRDEIHMDRILRAQMVVNHVEHHLMSSCPGRLRATFLISKADVYIRKALVKGNDQLTTLDDRAADLRKAQTVLQESRRISKRLKLRKEIDGIDDRQEHITALLEGGLQELDFTARNSTTGLHGAQERNSPCENDCFEDLLNNLSLEDDGDGRLNEQCTE
ncbi:uncharacterized protein LOC116613998 [Nematostella vectensis]|uniref:uncharacterized protein LOC116613998 n=1 Tax=Nematostella vectensis TaxID=45351 RepID=UPI0020773298|nr:uncharacterized protein LOC116613998 [Nematostella vectensis]